MNKLQIITSGILKNNPTFVLVLGMCPTLGTTTSAINGMGMGVATMAVLIMSNLVISLIKNLIPSKVRIPAFIVVIASFVTIIQMLMQAYVPSLYASLGVFIPLIVFPYAQYSPHIRSCTRTEPYSSLELSFTRSI